MHNYFKFDKSRIFVYERIFVNQNININLKHNFDLLSLWT
jgi:hypothetical protein